MTSDPTLTMADDASSSRDSADSLPSLDDDDATLPEMGMEFENTEGFEPSADVDEGEEVGLEEGVEVEEEEGEEDVA